MNYDNITPFISKRNHVFLAQGSSERSVVVKDFGQSADSYAQELKVSRILYDAGVSVPDILEASNNRIVYSYIEGTLAVDLLGQLAQPCYSAAVTTAFENICQWLCDCYSALEAAFSCEMILGDAHLRNFICGNRTYGIDFECVTPGRRETDIASLAVFTVTYSPSCTPAKYALAAFICSRCIELMGLDTNILVQEMGVQLEVIASRRRTAMPAEIIPELEKRLVNHTLAVAGESAQA